MNATLKTINVETIGAHVRLASAIDGLGQWYRQAITARELAKLEPHRLSDIGLTRADIPVAARMAARRVQTQGGHHA